MGHRIELEEIEHAMEQINGVERCVCVVDEKRKKLAVFYQGTSDTVLCREQMKRKLPTYMIPHKMIKTTLIPLTKNGKTDREYFRRKLR